MKTLFLIIGLAAAAPAINDVAPTEKLDEIVEDAVRFADESPWPKGSDALCGVFEDDSIVPYTPWWEK